MKTVAKRDWFGSVKSVEFVRLPKRTRKPCRVVQRHAIEGLKQDAGYLWSLVVRFGRWLETL